jgi:cytochrome c oxidase subunit 2
MEDTQVLIRSLLLLLTLCISHSGKTQETPTPKGLEYCTVCHGSQLKGNANIGAPRLSGLPQWYLERQLINFKEGIRGVHSDDERGREMRMMVNTLTDAEIKSIAAWVVKTDSDKPSPTLSADTLAGKTLYQSCIACHGSNGEGNKALGAPSLNGLNDWYLATQLNHFRLNLRGTQSNDVYGQQMKAASTILASERDAEDLAAYIITLPTQSE